MDKEIERKIGLLHAAAGFAAGIISGLYLSEINLTLLNVLFFGIIAAYPLRILSMKLFNLSEFLLKDWLTKGYLLFFIVWIILWTFVYNL
ncbi:MAG: DUF5379 family protein [Euryarchaeota archaeon]|nr:DUF5379 family protein [Euryarchaeota archaeon]